MRARRSVEWYKYYKPVHVDRSPSLLAPLTFHFPIIDAPSSILRDYGTLSNGLPATTRYVAGRQPMFNTATRFFEPLPDERCAVTCRRHVMRHALGSQNEATPPPAFATPRRRLQCRTAPIASNYDVYFLLVSKNPRGCGSRRKNGTRRSAPTTSSQE
jgi:hypothetical protein